ncbi:ParB/Srx family N-terminal domain-containing protein [Chromobacterium sp. ASV23]|uniref:ParB/Srx family N-terminal domain-containing protein n=1 Tax=Chromobacterium sp. ASV23 TaxID=2795110 RepID=UPI0018EDF3DC|nr:ParB/Srx family N-terminal domain-containing protein [Chromobacterium sp. ASV23]
MKYKDMDKQETMLLDVEKLIPYEKNVKKHPAEKVKKLAESIKKFGWRGNPIIIDQNFVILAGHGRRLAAIELGLKQVPVVQVTMTEDEARAFRLADNRVAVGDYDQMLLREEVIGIEELLGDIFDDKELEFTLADLGEVNLDVFVDERLNDVVDEQRNDIARQVSEAADKEVPITRALGFSKIKAGDMQAVNKFIAAAIQATGITDPDRAFVAFVKEVTA